MTNRKAIGVDVGGTKVLAGLVEFGSDGVPNLLESHKVRVDGSPAGLIDQIIKMATQLDPQHQYRVGVGLPGFVDHGGIARAAPNLQYLIGVDLMGPLRAGLGTPVTIDNDANAAAAGIAATDAAGFGDVVVATLGTGIGGGLLLSGSLYRGHRGFAGEIGHLVVCAGGLQCPCGQRGCWEEYASGSALGRHAMEYGNKNPGGLLGRIMSDGGKLSSPKVLELAVAGEPEAQEVLETWAEWVSVGLISLNSILDPARIVLGGGIIEEADVVFELIRSKVDESIGSIGPDAIEILPTTLGPEAGAIGAAVLAAKL